MKPTTSRFGRLALGVGILAGAGQLSCEKSTTNGAVTGGGAAGTSAAGGHHSGSGGTGGTAGAGATEAGAGGSSATGGSGNGCVPFAPPEQVPDGWVAFSDFSCSMPLWLPAEKSQLPRPIEWGPCADYLPKDMDCRQMDVFWEWEGGLGSRNSSLHIPDDGSSPVLFFMRSSGIADPPSKMLVIADVDGSVHFAAMITVNLSDGMSIAPALGFDGVRFGVQMSGDERGQHADKSEVQGVAVGRVGSLGLEMFRKEDDLRRFSWYVNSQYVLRVSAPDLAVDVYPTDDSLAEATSVYRLAEDPDGIQTGPIVMQGEHIVFTVNDRFRAGIMGYAAEGGLRPLVRRYGDLLEGDFNAGTDGKHLVWTHGSDHPEGEANYPTKTVMVSPYAMTAEEIKPRALTTDPTYGEIAPFKVGCGYAAHDTSREGTGIQVVRLSDGHSWYIGDEGDEWRLVKDVLGITCEEIFLRSSAGNVLRVRLDSLGPGKPAELPD